MAESVRGRKSSIQPAARSTGLTFRWLVGFGFSLMAIWAVTAWFSENYYPREWNSQLKRNVAVSGSTFQQRSEGWATTRFGELGLVGQDGPLEAETPKVLIWGDSFVEAFHVDDDDKMHRQWESMAPEVGFEGMQCVAVGHRWWSVADYLFLMPRMESAVENARLHVVHLHTLQDILPDRYRGDRMSLFLSEPELHFEEYANEYQVPEPPAEESLLSRSLFAAKAHFFLRMKAQLTSLANGKGMRFALGRQQGTDPSGDGGVREWNQMLDPDWIQGPAPTEAWDFALSELQTAASAPILFVYAPATPSLDRGRAVLENPEQEWVKKFEKRCRAEGIGFVNLDEAFRKFVNLAGDYPRGFSNSRPWEGHYNREGHRLVARAILEWMNTNRHVVYPD